MSTVFFSLDFLLFLISSREASKNFANSSGVIISGLATIDSNTGIITATGKESDTTNAKVSAKFVKASTG